MAIESATDVQRTLDELIDSTWAFAAVATAFEVGLTGALGAPVTPAEAARRTGLTDDLTRALLDVLVSLDLAQREGDQYQETAGLRDFLSTSQREDVLAWLRSNHLQSRAMVDAARHGELRPGWIHTDPEMLQAQGRTGRGSVHALAAQLFPILPGLQERLQSSDGRFLDIGMGVGIMAIEMCRIYPNLHVVGLEPGTAQVAEARRNIAEAGFEDRIEIRQQPLEELDDRDAYDFVYLPQVFMPVQVVEEGLRRALPALRPGGWISLVVFDAPGTDVHATTSRLLNVMWGGTSLSPEDVANLTQEAGFEMVQVGGDPRSTVKGVIGRRPIREE